MGAMSTMLPLIIGGYANGVAVPKTDKAATGNGQQTGSGLFNYSTYEPDNSMKGSNNWKYNPIEYSPYAPIQHTVNFTITGSDVSDTGNTQYANPTTFTPSTTQSDRGEYEDRESSGIDLTSILVPVAGIAGVAALAYAAMTIFGDDAKKAVTKKKSGGQKNE